MKKWHKIFSEGVRVVRTEEEMRALGRELAGVMEAGDVIGLVGDLGAGKTRLVQGALAGLGSAEAAVSPTFSLVHEHTGERLKAAHFDFYRMESPDEAIGLGWDEYLSSGAVLLVEWADRFDGALMPRDTVWLVIRRVSESEREVSLAQAEG